MIDIHANLLYSLPFEQSVFQRYAPFVHRLIFNVPWPGRAEDPDFINLIRHSQLSTVFPNLRYLSIGLKDWEDQTADILKCVLDTPNLQELSIHFSYFSSIPTAVISVISSKILSRNPGIASFSCSGESNYPPSEPPDQNDMTTLVGSMTQLTSLTMSGIQAQPELVWTACSRLPSLRTLIIINKLVPINDPSQLPLTGFPSLVDLTIHAISGNKQDIPYLLGAIKSPNLKSVRLNVDYRGENHDADDGGAAIEAVGSHGYLAAVERFSELDRLHINCPGIVMGWEDITPLMSCRRMTDIMIATHQATFALTDERLSSLARAWPSLRAFRILDPQRLDYVGKCRQSPFADSPASPSTAPIWNTSPSPWTLEKPGHPPEKSVRLSGPSTFGILLSIRRPRKRSQRSSA